MWEQGRHFGFTICSKHIVQLKTIPWFDVLLSAAITDVLFRKRCIMLLSFWHYVKEGSADLEFQKGASIILFILKFSFLMIFQKLFDVALFLFLNATLFWKALILFELRQVERDVRDIGIITSQWRRKEVTTLFSFFFTWEFFPLDLR